MSSCSSKPKDLIIGKWKTTDGSNAGIDFAKDKFVLDNGNRKKPTDGNEGHQYHFVDDNTVEAADGKIRFKVSVKDDVLTIDAPDTPSEQQLVSFSDGKIVLQIPPPKSEPLKLKKVK